jgi:hypothetical protein
MTTAQKLCAYIYALIGVIVGAYIGFGGTRFHHTPSLLYVHNIALGALRVPWPAWGILFWIYAGLLLTAVIRYTPGHLGTLTIGLWLGFALYALFCLSLVYSASGPSVINNPVVTGAAIGYALIHVATAYSVQRADATNRS